jgi:hypothetical protein
MFPLSEAEILVQSFLDGTLNKYDWTHEAHLVVGMYMVTHHEAAALEHMRKAIRSFNETTGTENTDTSGYHETLTVFWLERIRAHCTAPDGTLTWDQDTLDHLLFSREMSNRNVWLEHYDEDLVKSVEARRGYVQPVR